jgi:hypothetical protein
MTYLYRTTFSASKDYSVQEQLEHLYTQLLRRVVSQKSETTLLEPLGEQTETRAVPEHALHVITATIHEQEQAAAQRILPQDVSHDCDQTVELLAHIDGVLVREDPLDVSSEHNTLALHSSQRAVGELDLQRPTTDSTHRGLHLDEVCRRSPRRRFLQGRFRPAQFSVPQIECASRDPLGTAECGAAPTALLVTRQQRFPI